MWPYTSAVVLITLMGIFKRSPGDSNGQQSLGVTMIKNDLRSRMEEGTLGKVVRGGLSGDVMFQFQPAMRRAGERVSMSHVPGDTFPGLARDVCSLRKIRWLW